MDKRGARLLRWVVIVGILLFLLSTIPEYAVEWLWLRAVDYEIVFWKIRITKVVLFLVALLVAIAFLGLNVRYMTRNLRPLRLNLGYDAAMDAQRNVKVEPKHIKLLLYGFIVFVSFVFAINYLYEWDNYFRFRHAQSFGESDPIFGNDFGFYMFKLPFIEMVQLSLAFLAFFATAITIAFYFFTGSLHMQNTGKLFGSIVMTKRVRSHVFTNLGIWLLLFAFGYYLKRYKLLYSDGHLIFGAGYTDVNVSLPVIWVVFTGLVLLAILSFMQIFRQNFKWLMRGGILIVLVILVGGLLPGIVQSYKVKPNELKLEEPYLKHNIKDTRLAYDLERIKVHQYNANDSITYRELREHDDVIKNIRLWDQELIVETYRQLQEIRLYYQFFDVDLDRYKTSEGYRQVLISGRELKTNLPPKAQTWVNKHLQYTHGYGVVMSPTTEKTEHGSPEFYIKDIPPKTEIDINVEQAAIYYGESRVDYKLVNTEIGEFHYPKGEENVYINYDGNGGVPINSLLRKTLFAWKFKDINLLLTDYLHSGSKIQFWRTIQERIGKIAPFLDLSDDPYLVIDDGRLFWIQDAYTLSSHFPYSKPYRNKYNYIRNSVKIVVDAYHGDVSFYISDDRDPILNVYKDIFPDMFKPMEEMPGELIHHIKYPKHLFEVQMELYSEYHMTNIQVFYNQEDLWEKPVESYGGHQVRMRPYYVLSSLPGENQMQYLLIFPMTPSNRDNMIAWATVKSDVPDYGEIIVYELPKERLFLGPAQMEAKIDQNTEISRDLSLWDQRGSKVIRGNLMIIPIKQSFLYIEPVFLISTDVNMPQLKRVIASTGGKVVMEPTLDEAIKALYDIKEFDESELIIPVLDSLLQDGEISEEVLQKVVPGVSNKKLEEVGKKWDEVKKAMQDGDWKKFGEKMDELNRLMEEE